MMDAATAFATLGALGLVLAGTKLLAEKQMAWPDWFEFWGVKEDLDRLAQDVASFENPELMTPEQFVGFIDQGYRMIRELTEISPRVLRDMRREDRERGDRDG